MIILYYSTLYDSMYMIILASQAMRSRPHGSRRDAADLAVGPRSGAQASLYHIIS